MKKGFIDLIGKARQKRGEKFRHQLYIFAVCLLISIFIWALVRLSRDYYYTINYRVVYTNLPSSLRLTSFSDSIITLSVRLQGFDFFTEEFLHPRNTLYSVSLRKMKIHNEDGQITGYLPTADIGREIKSQMNLQSEVYMVFPDTLFFSLEKTLSGKIKHITPKPATLGERNRDSLDLHKVN